MKHCKLGLCALCLLVLASVSSCRGGLYDDEIVYSKWYHFNYYLTNDLDTTVTFYFSKDSHSAGFAPSEQTLTLLPSTSATIYDIWSRTGAEKDSTDSRPIMTPESGGTEVVLYDPAAKDGADVTTYLLIGENRKEFDFDKDNHPFYTKNYRVSIEQDTIFNFYFSIDSTFVQTLK